MEPVRLVMVDVYLSDVAVGTKPAAPVVIPRDEKIETLTRVARYQVRTAYKKATWSAQKGDRLGVSLFATRKGDRVSFTVYDGESKHADTVTIPSGQALKMESARKDGSVVVLLVRVGD